MRPTITNASFSLRGALIDELPDCPGIYRFHDADGQLLYVGKSIHVRSRVASHFAAAAKAGRQQRMMHAVARIDCEPCTGEIGALLRENAAIKREIPLYNRRQRRPRKLWTLALMQDSEGVLHAQPQQLETGAAGSSDSVGLYRSAAHAEGALRQLARDGGLCLRALGLEHGRGPCFAYQLKRCRGACAGVEAIGEHNARLRDMLHDLRVVAWPFQGAVMLRENASQPRHGQPRDDWHLVHQWRYLGSFSRRRSAVLAASRPAAADATDAAVFDRDAYLILLRALRDGITEVHGMAPGEPLTNPLRRQRP